MHPDEQAAANADLGADADSATMGEEVLGLIQETLAMQAESEQQTVQQDKEQ